MAAQAQPTHEPGPETATLPLTLLAIFAAWFIALGIRPVFRQDWLLENVLVLVAVPIFVGTCRRPSHLQPRTL